MWSTDLLANGFNQVPTTSQTSLDDLDDINFSFNGVTSHERYSKTSKSLHAVGNRDGYDMLSNRDVWSFKSRVGHIDKVPIHQTLSQPSTISTQKQEISMKNPINQSTTSQNIPSVQTIHNVDITRPNKKEPLGFFIRQGDGFSNKTGIFISRVTKGSLAETGGLLKVGDEILRINDVDIKGYSLTDVVQLIQAPTRLVLTLRTTLNRVQERTRPSIYTRHSSPSLFKSQENDLSRKTSRNHTRESDYMTVNTTAKRKQKGQSMGKTDANEPSYDLAKNTSTIDELIRLLRAHTEEQNTPKNDVKSDQIVGDSTTVDFANPDSCASTLTQTNINDTKSISTLTPATTVDLLFDDDDLGAKTHAPCKPHPYNRNSITKFNESVSPDKPASRSFQTVESEKLNVTTCHRSRSSSYGSSGSLSPKPRRRLPSLPTEEEQRKRTDYNMSARGGIEKLRRKLPTPPASPIMTRSHRFAEHRKQKTLSLSSPDNGEVLTDIKEVVQNVSAMDTNNNKAQHLQITPEKSPANQTTREHDLTTYNREQSERQTPKSPSSVIYRRSQSQHSDFFEQQRHSMFLQSFSSGKNNTDSTRNSTCLSLSLDSRDSENTMGKPVEVDYLSVRNARGKAKSREGSPNTMRRHGSSSLLFRINKSISPAVSRSSMESDPGFQVFPDDFKDVDLSCSHAVSGMMNVRILKAANLNQVDKKRHKKICCAVEVDFESKATTSSKKVSKNPSWDEVFEVEIQHGREMSFLCYGCSKKEFDTPIARASFYLTPLVRQSRSHQLALRLTPEGILYIELEFTEIKTLLKRTQSSKNSGIFGFNLSITSEQEHGDVPVIVRKCVSEIEKRGLDTVGLYRISGNARKKQAIKAEFEDNSLTADISEDNCPDINVVTGVLKDYLRELPEPLITEKMSQQLIQGMQENIQDKEPKEKKGYLCKVLSELPVTYKNTLSFILSHLCRVMANDINKMDSRNLSVCLAPVLQYSPTNLSDPKDLLGLKTYLKAVEVLIDVWSDVETMEREKNVLTV